MLGVDVVRPWDLFAEEDDDGTITVGEIVPTVDGGGSAVTFPTTKLAILVELLINGVWIDVSTSVKYESKIVITRGRGNEQGIAGPSQCALTFKNPDRRFSPRNTTSDLYPYLGQGTGLRVSINAGDVLSVRFTGEVPEWPPRWTTGEDRSVDVVATGPLRVLEPDDEDPASSIYRRITTDDVQPIAYWPCEDDSNATEAASAIAGVPAMVAFGGSAAAGGVKFGQGTSRSQAAYTGFEVFAVGTKTLPSLGEGGILLGIIPESSPSPVQWTVQFVGRLWAFTGFAGTNITLCRWATPGGTFVTWEVRMLSLDGGIELVGTDATGAQTVLMSPPITFVDLVQFRITATQNGANVDSTFRVSRVVSGAETGSALTDSRAGTLGMAKGAIRGNPDGATLAAEPIGGSENQINDIIVGHISVWNTITSVPSLASVTLSTENGKTVSVWNGWLNERPTDRFARVCANHGIAYTVLELVPDKQLMGPEGITTVPDILRACEQTSEGLLDETRTGELRLASRTARWIPDVALIVDYEHATYGNQVLDIQPSDDDFALVNDWTVNREDGSFARARQLTGPLNVNSRTDDPEGVGTRKKSATLSLYADAQAVHHAYWRLRKGTVFEVRYPLISLALHRNPELIPEALSADINGRLRLLNPPTDVGPGTIDQYIEGTKEEITQFTIDLDFNCSPVSAGEAWRWSDPSGAARYSCSGSTLSAAVSSSATTLNLTITDNCVWAHDNGDFTITVGGEDMTVTAVGAASGTYPSRTQALTVTRSVNGAVLAHAAGVEIRLKTPARYAL